MTKHYQWMVRHDYLPRICDPAVVDDVLTTAASCSRSGADPTQVPTMPVEFSVAAFRLGHSMIRAKYDWNVEFDNGTGSLPLLFDFSGTSGFLGQGFAAAQQLDRRLAAASTASSRYALKVPNGKFNLAKRIDTRLVDPLAPVAGRLVRPARTPPRRPARREPRVPQPRTGEHDAGWPPARAWSRSCKSKGVAVTALTDAQLRNGVRRRLDRRPDRRGGEATFLDRTPLWFYILREAELNDGKLAGVGARIVAETFHHPPSRAAGTSILRDTDFKPKFGPDDSTFDMRDLLFFAFEGKKACSRRWARPSRERVRATRPAGRVASGPAAAAARSPPSGTPGGP